MASHEPFGHLQHKLWSKEGPGVKLAIWLPTTKSQKSTQFRCVQVKYDTPLERSRRELQLWFRPHLNPGLGQEIMNVQSPGSPKRQFWDSTLGVPGKRAIWMQVRQRATENTIWGKVVASSESGSWWVKWVQGSSWLDPTPKGCKMSSNQLVGWIWM
jgi:hypothetical protein